ncbi:alpha/beta fold hydrolase [Kordiimonas sp.]|uniref:alpha/beta fold hydrolase n=1 Tax=Kordiimonas sp. TaxID=1970157 RepID=UPI003A947793
MAFKTDAILFLPALLCDSRLYKSMINNFSDHVEVSVADTFSDDNLKAMAERAIHNMPERCALVGNSMGGYLALEIAARAPDRVSHLALIGTNSHADDAAARTKREQAIRLAERGRFSSFVDGYVESALSFSNGAEHAPLIREMARDLGADTLIAQQRAIMDRRSHEDKLGHIKVPSLVMVGREDGLADTAHQQTMAKRLPNCRYIEVPKCGHLVPLEAPEILNSALTALLSA